jgi:hypothetical protein
MSVNLHFLFFGCPAASFIIIKKVGRRFKSYIIVKSKVFGCRLPVAVRCFLVIKQAERLIGITFRFQPVEGGFGDDFGAVACINFGKLSCSQSKGCTLSTFPFKKLCFPVSKTARLGAQMEFVTVARVNMAPSLANLSILGVGASSAREPP